MTGGAALGSYGLYKLYHRIIYSEPSRVAAPNPAERHTSFSALLHRSWDSDRQIRTESNHRGFITSREGFSTVEAFVWDPSRSTRLMDEKGDLILDQNDNPIITEKVIYSEGMDFGLRRALQMDDQQTVMKLRMGIKQLTHDGLPAWRSYVIDGRLVIKNDRDAASALDADMGIAFGFLEAAGRLKAGVFKPEGDFTYERLLSEAQQMMGIIYEKGVKPLGPHLLFGPSEDWGYEQGAVVYNVSYPALYMLEAFAATDPVAGHNWRQVIEDNQALRKAIVGLTHIKDGRGNLVELRGLPDWVNVVWSPEKGFEFYTPGDRSYLPGYDSYRTLLNIALDASLARDPQVRAANAALAVGLMQKVAGTDAEQTLTNVSGKGVYTAVPGEAEPRAIVCREFVLGAYTALAFAAGHPHRNILAEHLKNSYQDGFNKDNDPGIGGYCPADTPYSRDFEFTGIRIEDRYYDQFIIWLAMQTFESAYRRFDPALFSAEGKEKQEFCARHHCDFGAHLEYIPYLGGHGWYVDPEERAELDLAKLVALLDYQGADNLAVELQAAGSWKKLQYLDQAILEYMKILKRNISPSANREALEGLTGALKDKSAPADVRIDIIKALDFINNPYVRLGLAQSMLDSGRPEYLQWLIQFMPVLTEEKYSFDQKLRAQAYMIMADAYLGLAQKEEDEYTILVSLLESRPGDPDLKLQREENKYRLNALLIKALNNTISALCLPDGVNPEVSALAYLKRGQIYHYRAQIRALAEVDNVSGRLIARTEDLDRAERDYFQALAPNSLPGLAASDAMIGIAKVRKEKALVRTWQENELDGYYNKYLEYLPEKIIKKDTPKEMKAEEIEINRDVLRRDPHFKSAEAIYDHILGILSGHGSPLNPHLESELSRIIDLNLARITNVAGNKDEQRISRERNNALELLFVYLHLSLVNLSTFRDEKIALIQPNIEQIRRLTPEGGIAGHLGRILFYIKNHEIRKALEDCNSLSRMAGELSSSDYEKYILGNETIVLLRYIDSLAQSVQRGERSFDVIKVLLYDAFQQLPLAEFNPLLKDIREEIARLTGLGPIDQRMESLRELIERAVEENEYLRAAAQNPAVRNNILNIMEIIGNLRRLINDERFQEASKYLEEYLRNEGSFGQIYYDELSRSLKTVYWSYFRPDHPEIALGLVLELLGEDHPEIVSPILSILRDRQAKNYLASYLNNGENRRSLHKDAADMRLYSAQENLQNKETLASDLPKTLETLKMLRETKRHYFAAMGLDPSTYLSDIPAFDSALSRDPKIKEGFLNANQGISTIAGYFEGRARTEIKNYQNGTGSLLSAAHFLYEAYTLNLIALDFSASIPQEKIQSALEAAIKRDGRNNEIPGKINTLQNDLAELAGRFGETFLRNAFDLMMTFPDPNEGDNHVHP